MDGLQRARLPHRMPEAPFDTQGQFHHCQTVQPQIRVKTHIRPHILRPHGQRRRLGQ